jgi:hypothetical protein
MGCIFNSVGHIITREIPCVVLWRTINLGRPVIGLTSKCEAGIMFNRSTNPIFDFCHSCHRDSDN